MRWIKKALFLMLTVITLIAISALIFVYNFLEFTIDLLWFKSLDYGAHFWIKTSYQHLVFLSLFFLMFLFFFFNYIPISRSLKENMINLSNRSGKWLLLFKRLIGFISFGSRKLYAVISAVLAFFTIWPFFEKWQDAMLFAFSRPAGVMDPIFGKDISYYLFRFPCYQLLIPRLEISISILFVTLLGLYWVIRSKMTKEERQFPSGGKKHLFFIAFLLFLLQIWNLLMQRHALVYTDSHFPIFYGPGYLEMKVQVPFIWAQIVTLTLAFFFTIALLSHKKALWPALAFIMLFLSTTGLRYYPAINNMLEKYIVAPNEFSRETTFIRNNIEATLHAYNLNDAEIREYSTSNDPNKIISPDIQNHIPNVPVWDNELLDLVYDQMQGIMPYYQFRGVFVDRYMVNGQYQQVYIGAREINLENLPSHARNWTNKHMQYTHGMGAAMSPASQDADQLRNLVWLMKDIPPVSEFGFTLKTPQVYFGTDDYGFSIVPNDVGEIDMPDQDKSSYYQYSGEGGVPISSLFNKLLFSFYFKDRNILYTTKTNSKSRILFRRNIIERIKRLMPHLLLDTNPYVVLTPERLIWIVDGYTVSNRYPGSTPYKGKYNYIRNSVKIAVDSYSGRVSFYVVDKKDPIIQTYKRAYPGVFQSLEKMPENLRSHLRYPKDIFETQLSIFAKYHQKKPESLYREEDVWSIPEDYRSTDPIKMKPYYATLNLIDPNKKEFILLCPMVPKGVDNLRALIIAGCDPENYGKIVVYRFSMGNQVFGPSQINALIDQDTEISQQFTLWDQAGSKIIRGKMIILPIKETVFYVQPVYLSAQSRPIPELKRLIISQGDVVVMETSIQKGFEAIANKLSQKLGIQVNPLIQNHSPIHSMPIPGKENTDIFNDQNITEQLPEVTQSLTSDPSKNEEPAQTPSSEEEPSPVPSQTKESSSSELEEVSGNENNSFDNSSIESNGTQPAIPLPLTSPPAETPETKVEPQENNQNIQPAP